MANSQETAVEALRTYLETNKTSATYVPDAIKRTSWFDDIDLDASLNATEAATTVWLIVPGPEQRSFDANRCGMVNDLSISIYAAKRFEEPTENPHLAAPVRWQYGNEMATDVLKPIISDFSLGGAVWNTKDFAVDLDQFAATWAVAVVRFTLTYRHAVGSR